MCREQHLGRYLEGQGHSMTVQQNRVRSITLLLEVRFYNYFTEMITLLRWHVAHNILVASLKVKVTAWPCSKNVSGSLLCHLKSDFITILQKWTPYWDDVSCTTFWSLPWRSRSQHDLAPKPCPPHNFVIWSLILKLFQGNDLYIKSPCREQHFGRYLEGQGHSMTLQQNRVRPRSLWFEVGFYNYLTERIIDGKKQELMIIKELFEGPVGDYCIARNTIKCLFLIQSSSNVLNIGGENVYSRSIIHVWRAYLVTMSPFFH